MSEPMRHAVDESLDHLAVIGLAGRFPGAAEPRELWRNLAAGVDSIRRFTDEELRAAGVAPRLLEDPRYVKARGVLEHADRFDAELFGIPPSEAELLDPQHRVLLECAWNALEDAGYAPGVSGERRIGVFAGSVLSTYLLHHLLPRAGRGDDVGDWRMVLANDKDTLSPRISYKLGLKGPSVTVQTACSTSLVAVHLAAQSLLSFECDLALAGGVSVRCPLVGGYLYHEEGIASPDGRCRPFDARAAGTVFGSGVGLVVLKRLEDALADGDSIRAVLRGSAINNDGADKIGFTAPGSQGQTEVVVRAQAMAEVDPATVTYVEAHGTATPLGDPIEVEALTRAFRAGTRDTGFCALGSVKSNLGHLDGAAGIAGLIKTILALEHETIPASLHFERPNPRIDFDSSPFYVATETRPWPVGSTPRRAGVSSFGIGGSNAHVILEEAPARYVSATPPRPAELLVVSAATRRALERSLEQLREHLEAEPGAPADVAYTLAMGRHPFRHRLARVCRDAESMAGVLAGLDDRDLPEPAETPPPVCFLFPGQGAQRPGMGRELYASQPVFRRELDRAAEILQPRLGRDLRPLLLASDDEAPAAARELDETRVAQPALFAFEAALARTWMAFGVEPRAMLGHSLGEYVAAHLAGVFDLETGLALVADRGELMQQAPPGAMLAVRWSEDRLRELLEERIPTVVLAAVNGAEQIVVSGPEAEVEVLRARLGEQGIAARRLETSHAFHSPLLDPVVEPFRERVGRVRLQEPTLRWISNSTGTWIRPDEATDPAYWARHLRAPVRFGAGLELVGREAPVRFLEVGPGQALTRLAQQRWSRERAIASLGRANATDGADTAALLSALGRLWEAGATVRWEEVFASRAARRVPLPTYPFERARHWIEAPSVPARIDATLERGEETEPAVAETPRSMPAPPTEDAFEDPLERQVASVWRDVLGVQRIGPEDDFLELGGDSLLALQAVTRLRERFSVDLSVRSLLEDPTVPGVARVLEERLTEAVESMSEDDARRLLETIS